MQPVPNRRLRYKTTLKGKPFVPSKGKPTAKLAPSYKPAAKQAKMKRPAAAGSQATKRPASVAETEFTSEQPPTCPAAGDKTPITYNGGRIYNTPDKFRVLCNKNDAYTERSFSHKKWGREPGFKLGLQAVDDNWTRVANALSKKGEDVD